MKPGHFFLFLVLWISSCSGNDQSSMDFCTAKPWYQGEAMSVNEDQVMMSLSAELIPNPQVQGHFDHNDIIAFAIDHAIDLKVTPSGLFYYILEEGVGNKIDWGEKIEVHYKGFYLDGRMFDSSCRNGDPLEIQVGTVINGWNEGLQLLGAGGKAILFVPSRLAYGEEGLKDSNGIELVPPNQVLIFELQVGRKISSVQ
jgi:FKBP-type peptidyl-prolyl cis-trans isomerase